MRVLIVSSKTFPSKGGVEFIVDTLAKGLNAKGHQVSVITNFYRTASAGLSEWKGFLAWFKENSMRRVKAFLGIGDTLLGYKVVETYFIFWGISRFRSILSFLLFPLTFLHYLYHLALIRPQVINLHFADNATAYVLLTKLISPKTKIVLSLHGDDVLKFCKNRIHKFLVSALIKRADSIVAVSKHFTTQIRDMLGYQGEVKIIYNCIDDEFLDSPVQPKREELPERYIVAVGRLVEKKGFDILIEAFRKFQKKSQKEIHLLIVGGGIQNETLRKDALGLWVSFAGARSRDFVMNALDYSEFFICPSREEPFGIVNLEAMARGKPVLSSAVGGIPEYITDSKNGLLYEGNTADNLYRSMLRLYNDGELRRSLAAKGRITAKRRFTQKVMTRKYLDLYKSL